MYFSSKYIKVLFLYNILTHITDFILKIIALFNEKIAKGVKGRSQSFSSLKSTISTSDKVIWLHCASLGEYEQGLPVFEEIKKLFPDHKLVLSFFSPSGYENKKESSIADTVIYLPLDTKSNAVKLLDLMMPELVVFVKYEIWPNYLNEIDKRDIKALLISANFRKDHIYFRAIGRWMLKFLNAFNHIFVQNEISKQLLEDHNVNKVTVSGDTRFDRVMKQLKDNNQLSFLSQFKNGELCIVAGSTWPEDDILLTNYLNNAKNKVKHIIAPHNIKPKYIQELKSSIIKSTILYSEIEGKDISNFKVLIIDTIGLLSRSYAYADIAYVGGAMGTTGLHNTLEPAVFGIPIIIGPNYHKFPEAHDMIAEGGMYSVSTQGELNNVLNSLINDKQRALAGAKNYTYIKKNEGAVVQILRYLRK